MNKEKIQELTDGEIQCLISDAQQELEERYKKRTDNSWQTLRDNKDFQDIVTWANRNLVIFVKSKINLSSVLSQKIFFSPGGSVYETEDMGFENTRFGKETIGSVNSMYIWDELDILIDDIMQHRVEETEREVAKKAEEYGMQEKIKKIALEVGLTDAEVEEYLMEELY